MPRRASHPRAKRGQVAEIGIQPDILVCRAEHPIDREIREKLSLFCNVPVKAVIEEIDVESSIYELPLALQREEMDDLVVDLLGLDAPAIEHSVWIDIVRRLKSPSGRVDIGVVGKYIELQDAYKSVYESIIHAGIANDTSVRIVRLDAEEIEKLSISRTTFDWGVGLPEGFDEGHVRVQCLSWRGDGVSTGAAVGARDRGAFDATTASRDAAAAVGRYATHRQRASTESHVRWRRWRRQRATNTRVDREPRVDGVGRATKKQQKHKRRSCTSGSTR